MIGLNEYEYEAISASAAATALLHNILRHACCLSGDIMQMQSMLSGCKGPGNIEKDQYEAAILEQDAVAHS